MKVLFAGPTLFRLARAGEPFPGSDILCRPPAQQGDIARAVVEGATVLGLVDGRYEDVAAPWHKEILYALDRGVRVFGAASMGALRAAECAAFGMVPIGAVARRYIEGEITEDADVAQIHGPAELGCPPLTEAMVNIDASLTAAVEEGALLGAQAARLRAVARSLFFKRRTLPDIVEAAGFVGTQAEAIEDALRAHWRDIKRADALALVDAMKAAPDRRDTSRHAWRFQAPSAWRRFLSDIGGASA